MNDFRTSGMRERVFFISPGLEYLGINYFYLYENAKAK